MAITADEAKTNETIAHRVFYQLSEAILSGELPPGSKIREPELARKLGISRGPLREAIRRLQERKLVTSSPRLGARVVVLTPALLREIFIVREALEGIAAREAAKTITDEEIANLRALLKAHEKQFSEGNSPIYMQGLADADFHFAIVRCTRNQTLITLLCDEYYQLIRLYRQQHRLVSGRARRAFVEHCRILDALADRDADLAELLMRRHVAASRAGMEQSMRELEARQEKPAKSRGRSPAKAGLPE